MSHKRVAERGIDIEWVKTNREGSNRVEGKSQEEREKISEMSIPSSTHQTLNRCVQRYKQTDNEK